MGKKKKLNESEILVDIAIKGLQDKKGKNIICVDLRELDNSVCDFFILCTGTSNTQVNALADSVSEKVRKSINEKPWHFEGFGNAEWIILDYVTTVVHIFQQEARNFYNLEELWADAKITKIEE